MINNFKKPNLNAPRFREKRLGILNEETIKEFKEKKPLYSNIDNDKLKKIVDLEERINKINTYEAAKAAKGKDWNHKKDFDKETMATNPPTTYQYFPYMCNTWIYQGS